MAHSNGRKIERFSTQTFSSSIHRKLLIWKYKFFSKFVNIHHLSLSLSFKGLNWIQQRDGMWQITKEEIYANWSGQISTKLESKVLKNTCRFQDWWNNFKREGGRIGWWKDYAFTANGCFVSIILALERHGRSPTCTHIDKEETCFRICIGKVGAQDCEWKMTTGP